MKAKSLLFYLLTLCLPVSASAAGIPVLDVSNLGQTTMTAIEAVKQTAKQVQQYALQLQQFENMVKNTIAPAAYVWSEVGLMQNKMFSIQDQYNYYKNGGIEKYLNRFGNVNYYRDSENFDLDMFLQNRAEAIDSSKKANDSLAKTIDQQRSDLRKEAADLQSLQLQVQPSGRVERKSSYTSLSFIGTSSTLVSLKRSNHLYLVGISCPSSSSLSSVSCRYSKVKWVVTISEFGSSAGCCTGQKS